MEFRMQEIVHVRTPQVYVLILGHVVDQHIEVDLISSPPERQPGSAFCCFLQTARRHRPMVKCSTCSIIIPALEASRGQHIQDVRTKRCQGTGLRLSIPAKANLTMLHAGAKLAAFSNNHSRVKHMSGIPATARQALIVNGIRPFEYVLKVPS
jgi:hypothetical protein